MRRLLLPLLLTCALAPAAERSAILGQVQTEIRLTDGTVFTTARIVDYSLANGTAIIAEPRRLRTVPLDQLPGPLREQLLADASVKPAPARPLARPFRPNSNSTTPPPPPPDKVILPEPATPATPLNQLLKQASAAAPDELKFHLIKAYDRVGSLTCKIREVIQVPGWQKIRVSGDAAFTQWDARQGDHVWRTDKFEVEFAIVEGHTLKPDGVSFGGLSQTIAR